MSSTMLTASRVPRVQPPNDLTISLSLFPKHAHKNMEAKLRERPLNGQSWRDKNGCKLSPIEGWKYYSSKENETISELYHENPLLNAFARNEKHEKALKADYDNLISNLKKCATLELQQEAIKAAKKRGIVNFDNDGVAQPINQNFDFLVQELRRRVEEAITIKDLDQLKNRLRDLYCIMYVDSMKGPAGEAWKTRAICDRLSQMIRGTFIEGSDGVHNVNPFSEPMSRVYEAVRAKIRKRFGGIYLLKVLSPKTTGAVERIDGFHVIFDIFGSVENKLARKAWELFQSEKQGEVAKVNVHLVTAYGLLAGINPSVASSLGSLIERLSESDAGEFNYGLLTEL